MIATGTCTGTSHAYAPWVDGTPLVPLIARLHLAWSQAYEPRSRIDNDHPALGPGDHRPVCPYTAPTLGVSRSTGATTTVLARPRHGQDARRSPPAPSRRAVCLRRHRGLLVKLMTKPQTADPLCREQGRRTAQLYQSGMRLPKATLVSR